MALTLKLHKQISITVYGSRCQSKITGLRNIVRTPSLAQLIQWNSFICPVVCIISNSTCTNLRWPSTGREILRPIPRFGIHLKVINNSLTRGCHSIKIYTSWVMSLVKRGMYSSGHSSLKTKLWARILTVWSMSSKNNCNNKTHGQQSLTTSNKVAQKFDTVKARLSRVGISPLSYPRVTILKYAIASLCPF